MKRTAIRTLVGVTMLLSLFGVLGGGSASAECREVSSLTYCTQIDPSFSYLYVTSGGNGVGLESYGTNGGAAGAFVNTSWNHAGVACVDGKYFLVVEVAVVLQSIPLNAPCL